MDAIMVRCYRGVAKDNLHYSDASKGIAKPRGGPASPADHNDGDTNSEFTSWTTNRRIAKEKALDKSLGGRGVILQKDFDTKDIVASPDAYFEGEILVRGVVTDAVITEVF